MSEDSIPTPLLPPPPSLGLINKQAESRLLFWDAAKARAERERFARIRAEVSVDHKSPTIPCMQAVTFE